MEKNFSTKWVKSKQLRKQRKYRYNAPLHIRHKMLAGHLSEELRKKYSKRSFPLRKGDKVKVLRGNFKGKIGEIEEINMKKMKVYVKGCEIKKKAGDVPVKVFVNPSNVVVLSLNLNDKKRVGALERAKK